MDTTRSAGVEANVDITGINRVLAAPEQKVDAGYHALLKQLVQTFMAHYRPTCLTGAVVETGKHVSYG